MDAETFFQKAAETDYPNVMVFQLRSENPDKERTFSANGFNAITDNIHDFIVARTFGRWKLTKRGPKQLRIEVKLTWYNEPQELLEVGWPWYALDDVAEGLAEIDGQTRIPWDRVDN